MILFLLKIKTISSIGIIGIILSLFIGGSVKNYMEELILKKVLVIRKGEDYDELLHGK